MFNYIKKYKNAVNVKKVLDGEFGVNADKFEIDRWPKPPYTPVLKLKGTGEVVSIQRMPDGDFAVNADQFEIVRDKKAPYIPIIKAAGGGGSSTGLCFTANTAGSTIGMTDMRGGTSGFVPDLETSTDGQNWTPFIAGTDTITLANAGDKVYFRGNNPSGLSDGNSYIYIFVMTGSIAASEDITYLINKDGGVSVLPPSCFYGTFANCASLTSAPALPATTLAVGCYMMMFYGCSSLATAPELPATTLAESCYRMMFNGCTSLTSAPELPATTLADTCYSKMFYGCTSLASAPALPAITLVYECYETMFANCTSLTTAPELPATTLAYDCYANMFANCTSLNNIKIYYTGDFDDDFYNWVGDVASTGDFYYNGSDTTRGVGAIPNGWTVHTF